MNKQWVATIFLLWLLLFNVHGVYADESEKRFKDIAGKINAAMKTEAELLSPEKQGSLKEADKEKIKIAERQLRDRKNELRNFVKTNPQSIWADDAQYIIATLDIGNPRQMVLDYEFFLKEYPNMHIEDWTREMIIAPNPDMPLEYIVRIQLCFIYQDLGETEKLKHMCEESIKKYPDRAKIFEKLIQGNASASK